MIEDQVWYKIYLILNSTLYSFILSALKCYLYQLSQSNSFLSRLSKSECCFFSQLWSFSFLWLLYYPNKQNLIQAILNWFTKKIITIHWFCFQLVNQFSFLCGVWWDLHQTEVTYWIVVYLDAVVLVHLVPWHSYQDYACSAASYFVLAWCCYFKLCWLGFLKPLFLSLVLTITPSISFVDSEIMGISTKPNSLVDPFQFL